MTRKELVEVTAQYEEKIKEELAKGTDMEAFAIGFCTWLSDEMCYNHHERGQRLWAFFEAISNVKKKEG